MIFAKCLRAGRGRATRQDMKHTQGLVVTAIFLFSFLWGWDGIADPVQPTENGFCAAETEASAFLSQSYKMALARAKKHAANAAAHCEPLPDTQTPAAIALGAVHQNVPSSTWPEAGQRLNTLVREFEKGPSPDRVAAYVTDLYTMEAYFTELLKQAKAGAQEDPDVRRKPLKWRFGVSKWIAPVGVAAAAAGFFSPTEWLTYPAEELAILPESFGAAMAGGGAIATALSVAWDALSYLGKMIARRNDIPVELQGAVRIGTILQHVQMVSRGTFFSYYGTQTSDGRYLDILYEASNGREPVLSIFRWKPEPEAATTVAEAMP
jgi:hypothetical protein